MMNQNYALFAIPVLLILSVFFAIDPAFSELTIDVGNLLFSSGTAFFLEFDHAITQNRTVIFPDADITVVGTTNTQTLSGKTMDGDVNTFVDINESQMDVAVGASGLVLTSNGAGSPPTYQASAGGTILNNYDFLITTTNTGSSSTYTSYDMSDNSVIDSASSNFTRVFENVEGNATETNNIIQLDGGEFWFDYQINMDLDYIVVQGKGGNSTVLIAGSSFPVDTQLIEIGIEDFSSHTFYDIDCSGVKCHQDERQLLEFDVASSADNFSVGDRITVVSDNEIYISSASHYNQGEIHEVALVDTSANTITIQGGLISDFYENNDPRVAVHADSDFVQSPTLRDFSLIDSRTTKSTGDDNAGIVFHNIDNGLIEGIILEDTIRFAISCEGCTNTNFDDLYIKETRTATDETALRYGLVFVGGKDNTLTNSQIHNVRHCVDNNSQLGIAGSLYWGANYNTVVDSIQCYDTSSNAIIWHPQSIGATVSNSMFYGKNATSQSAGADCLGSRGNHSTFINNHCYNYDSMITTSEDSGAYLKASHNVGHNMARLADIQGNATNIELTHNSGDFWEQGIWLDGSNSRDYTNSNNAGDNSTFSYNIMRGNGTSGSECMQQESNIFTKWIGNECYDYAVGFEELDATDAGRVSDVVLLNNYFKDVPEPYNANAISVGELVMKGNIIHGATSELDTYINQNYVNIYAEEFYATQTNSADWIPAPDADGDDGGFAEWQYWEFLDSAEDRAMTIISIPDMMQKTAGNYKFDVRIFWSTQGGTTGQFVEWSIGVKSAGDDQASLATAITSGQYQNVTDNRFGAGNLQITDWVTIQQDDVGGSTATEFIPLQVLRDARTGNADDDCACDAQLIFAQVRYN